MAYDEVWEALKACLFETSPELSAKKFLLADSLRDMRANSVDRAEIIMFTMARLKLKSPLVNFAQTKNIGELVDVFHHHLQLKS